MKNMISKEKFYNLFWIFILGSIFGWFIEGVFSLIKWKMFINHSAVVIGPFNMAYGLGALMLSILLSKFKNLPSWKIFILAFLGGSILEYIMSLGMELVLGFTAWDYSRKPLNLNGRICVRYSLFWGILGIIWIKYIYPCLLKFISKINNKLVIYVAVFLIFDILLTGVAINRARAKENGIEARYTYEKVLDRTFNKEYLKNMYNESWDK